MPTVSIKIFEFCFKKYVYKIK